MRDVLVVKFYILWIETGENFWVDGLSSHLLHCVEGQLCTTRSILSREVKPSRAPARRHILIPFSAADMN